MSSLSAFDNGPVGILSPPVSDGMPVAWSQQVTAHTNQLLDQLEDAHREVSAAEAHRAEVLDALRLISEETAASVTDRATTHRWTDRDVARRCLVSEAATALHIPERTAERWIEDSGTLIHNLPATFAALQAGEISLRHATIMVGQCHELPTEVLSAFEAVALPYARQLTPSKFERRARQLRERVHSDTIEVRKVAALLNRELTITPAPDGMCWLNAYLPAEIGIAIENRLTDIARDLQGAASQEKALNGEPLHRETLNRETLNREALHQETETRTLAQLKADVFAGLVIDGVVDHSYADTTCIDENGMLVSPLFRKGFGHGIRATVLITVPVLTLLGVDLAGVDLAGVDLAGVDLAGVDLAGANPGGHEGEPAMLEGYGPIDRATAEALTATAPSYIRLLTDPHTGIVLGIGTTKLIPKELRRWLRTRDGRCRFPGCNQPARVCDLDHTVDLQFGGATEHTNLGHLCPKHHDTKHHTNWTVVQYLNGDYSWTSPSGRQYTTTPALRLQPSVQGSAA